MSITADTPVGELAAKYPLSTRVFARLGVDYCCGGGRPLREVCSERGLDVDHVLEEIRHQQSVSGISEVHWDEAPLAELIEHILSAYHRPLYQELPRLESMARKVLDRHREQDATRLGELLSIYVALRAELEQHMAKEEQILFPMIERGAGTLTAGPISVMQDEHDAAAAMLRRLRELTNGYQVPADACHTWRALWHGLASLEESLHEHIHLENNILFPRALAP